MYGVSAKVIRLGKGDYSVALFHGCNYDGKIIATAPVANTKRKRILRLDIVAAVEVELNMLEEEVTPDAFVKYFRPRRMNGGLGTTLWNKATNRRWRDRDQQEELSTYVARMFDEHGPVAVHPISADELRFVQLRGIEALPNTDIIQDLIYKAWQIPRN